MDDDYNALEISHDATQFAKSRFGQHYLERLRKAKEREMKLVTDTTLTDSFRAHAGTRIATIQSELDYFDVAESIQTNPKLLEKLRSKLTPKREEKEPIV